MRPRSLLTVLSLVGLYGTIGPALGQEHHKGHAPAEMNRQFSKPDLDVQEFIRRFESESRDIFVARQKIVEALDLRPGMAIADVGAGTGLFTWPCAERVGPKGTVYAVEIAPAFLRHIEEQAHKRHVENVKTVRATQETTNLVPGSTDLAFVCATYHHFEHPEKVLASIHRALRPGGRLVVIDFDLRKDSSEFVREHARGPKEVYFREIDRAGFKLLETKTLPGLKDNFFAVFERAGVANLPGDGRAGQSARGPHDGFRARPTRGVQRERVADRGAGGFSFPVLAGRRSPCAAPQRYRRRAGIYQKCRKCSAGDGVASGAMPLRGDSERLSLCTDCAAVAVALARQDRSEPPPHRAE